MYGGRRRWRRYPVGRVGPQDFNEDRGIDRWRPRRVTALPSNQGDPAYRSGRVFREEEFWKDYDVAHFNGLVGPRPVPGNPYDPWVNGSDIGKMVMGMTPAFIGEGEDIVLGQDPYASFMFCLRWDETRSWPLKDADLQTGEVSVAFMGDNGLNGAWAMQLDYLVSEYPWSLVRYMVMLVPTSSGYGDRVRLFRCPLSFGAESEVRGELFFGRVEEPGRPGYSLFAGGPVVDVRDLTADTGGMALASETAWFPFLGEFVVDPPKGPVGVPGVYLARSVGSGTGSVQYGFGIADNVCCLLVDLRTFGDADNVRVVFGGGESRQLNLIGFPSATDHLVVLMWVGMNVARPRLEPWNTGLSVLFLKGVDSFNDLDFLDGTFGRDYYWFPGGAGLIMQVDLNSADGKLQHWVSRLSYTKVLG